MAVYLSEDEFGGGTELCFPNLRSCMGVVVSMDDGHLYGAHVTGGTTEAALLAALKAKVVGHVGNPRDYFFIGDLPQHIGFGESIGHKIAAIGAKGMVAKVNLRSLSHPGPGIVQAILARVRSQGPNTVPALLAGGDPGGHAYTQTQAKKTVTTKDKSKIKGTDNSIVAPMFYTSGDNVVGLAPVPLACITYMHIA